MIEVLSTVAFVFFAVVVTVAGVSRRQPDQRVSDVVNIRGWKTFRQRNEEEGAA